MHWLEQHWYRFTPVSLLLLPLSWLYCLLIFLRRGLYRLGIFSSVRLPVPVIVVGNITVGGTGKTPLVIWLADFLRQQDVRASCRVAAARWMATDGHADHDPDVVGDEAMLARQSRCPVAADLTACAGRTWREHHCDVIVRTMVCNTCARRATSKSPY
jgi:tetraacyldisaccharide 4'-kinase